MTGYLILAVIALIAAAVVVALDDDSWPWSDA